MDILIVDDHHAMREEIASLLRAELESPAVAQAGTGEEGLDQARKLRPDIVLMDVVLPGMSGIDAAKAIHAEFPEIRILVLSNHAGRSLVEAAMSAGASGYVRKDRAYEQLLPAVRRLAAGGRFFADDLKA